MNDKWIKPFQDKLGDYEWDGAAPAPRRRVWLFPALAGAAAAAVLAFLLLRTPGAGKPQEFRNLIAEVPASVIVNQPASPTALHLARANRSNSPMDLSQPEPAATASVAQTATVEATPDETPTEEVQTEEIQAIEPTVGEGPVVGEEPAEILPEWPEEAPADRKTDISARLHINPIGLQTGMTALTAKQDAAIPVNALAGWPQGNSLFAASNQFDYSYLTENNNLYSKQGISEGAVRCDLPVKTGLSLRIKGPGRFSLESGLDYAFHHARFTYTKAIPVLVQAQDKLEYRMHYLGIPLKGIYSLADWKRLQLYAAAGGEMEWMVTGNVLTRAGEQAVTIQRIQEHPFLFSLTAGAGLEYAFNARLGLYAEPGIAWHFEPQGNLPNYYRDHPLSFDLHLGLRFNLN